MSIISKSIHPTDSELEILQVLWENGPSTVRQVNDRLNEKRIVGYTTSLKIMQIMSEKGLLSRRKKDRTHIYTPLLNQGETQSLMLNKLLKSAFGGSAGKLVLQALGNNKTSADELKQIKEIIQNLEKDQK